MTLISRIQMLAGMMVLGLALAGCDREQIKVQQVPKESLPSLPPAESTAMPSMPADPHGGMSMGDMGGAKPQLKWTLPAGWKEKPASQMRAASFDAQGADVSVIPLPSGD